MANITHDDIDVCQTCAVIHSYGDMTAEGSDEMFDAAMGRWGDLLANLVISCGHDEDECPFDWFRCDMCGQDIASYRHKAVIFDS